MLFEKVYVICSFKCHVRSLQKPIRHWRPSALHGSMGGRRGGVDGGSTPVLSRPHGFLPSQLPVQFFSDTILLNKIFVLNILAVKLEALLHGWDGRHRCQGRLIFILLGIRIWETHFTEAHISDLLHSLFSTKRFSLSLSFGWIVCIYVRHQFSMQLVTNFVCSRFVFQNLINWKEKEIFFLEMLRIKKRKRMGLEISQIEMRNIFFSL